MHSNSTTTAVTKFPPRRNEHEILRFNYGNPSPRSKHREQLTTTCFGDERKQIHFPYVRRLGLLFPTAWSPRQTLIALLGAQGMESPEELRARFAVPPVVLAIRALPRALSGFLVDVQTERPALILEQALLLGLCAPTFFDPQRPVIWTDTSLTRRVELYRVGDFYAQD